MEEEKKAMPAPGAAPNTIYGRLARAQAKFAPVVKNCVNPAFKSHYADLNAILTAVRPALNGEGVFVFQRVHLTHMGEMPGVMCETVLGDADGNTLESGGLFVPVTVRGGNVAQAYGSAETYARRYSLSAFLGIATEDDDDANALQGAPAAELDPLLITAGQAAAQRGKAAFRQWYEARPERERQLLTSTGMKLKLWNIAKGVPEGGQS